MEAKKIEGGETAAGAIVHDEHAAQLALLDQIEADVLRGANAGEVGRLLDHFIEHANAHFLSEKILMRNSAYAAYEQHVMEHDLLLSQARQFLADVEVGDVTDARAFVAALRNWLVIHMNTTDAAFESYLGQQSEAGVTGSEV